MASELWAGRAEDGRSFVFDRKPDMGPDGIGDDVGWLMLTPDVMPFLQHGQCVRVKIVPVEEGASDA